VIVRVATLDDDPGLKPAMHIWRAHDVGWLQDGEDVPSFQEWQPGR
jgi:ADP-ribosyl-[dinitrogen reductase] hydrolase